MSLISLSDKALRARRIFVPTERHIDGDKNAKDNYDHSRRAADRRIGGSDVDGVRTRLAPRDRCRYPTIPELEQLN